MSSASSKVSKKTLKKTSSVESKINNNNNAKSNVKDETKNSTIDNDLQVKNINYSVIKVEDSKELKELVDLMKKNGVADPMSLLPQKPKYMLSFELTGTYAGFANGFRRVLMEEIPTKCLDFENKSYETTDEFLLIDVVKKNINLIPIIQEFKDNKFNGYTISLNKYNPTNDIIEVRASDISIKAGKNRELPLSDLLHESNFRLFRLRPNKKIVIKQLDIIEGVAKDNAAKFSLLDNVSYRPMGMTPYDMFAHTGTRTSTVNPTTFMCSFLTCGNISVNGVVEKTCDVLKHKLMAAKNKLNIYTELKLGDNNYVGDNFIVENSEGIKKYIFDGEYITLAYMVGQRCYILDKNILFCAPGVDRYDNEKAIIRLKHPDADALLDKAIDECLSDVEKVRSALLQ